MARCGGGAYIPAAMARNSLGLDRAPGDTRVVVAMSGGVDSSVTAALLKEQGYDVVGITLQLYDHGVAVGKTGACCAGTDIQDARQVAERLAIPHYVLDYESRFRAEVMALWSNLPGLAHTLEGGIDGLQAELVRSYPQVQRFLPKEPRHEGWLLALIEESLGDPQELLAHAGLVAFIVALTPVFAFFFLRDGGAIVSYLIDRLHPAHIETTVAVWCEIDRIIGRYLRGLALDAIVIGALATLGLWLVGAPYPWLLGAFTALVNPLPYLGTILSVGVAAIAAIANGLPFNRIGWIVAVYVIIRILDDLVVAARHDHSPRRHRQNVHGHGRPERPLHAVPAARPLPRDRPQPTDAVWADDLRRDSGTARHPR